MLNRDFFRETIRFSPDNAGGGGTGNAGNGTVSTGSAGSKYTGHSSSAGSGGTGTERAETSRDPERCDNGSRGVGLAAKTIPYVLKMADLSKVTGEDGQINNKTLLTNVTFLLPWQYPWHLVPLHFYWNDILILPVDR